MSKIKKETVPSMDQMMAWTAEIFNQGIRRPGYPADVWAENWVKEHFEAFGLEDVNLDPMPVKKWEAQDANLEIWLVDKPNDVVNIPCFPIPYTSPTEGIEAELRVISDDTSISGKIAVDNLELLKLPIKLLKYLAGVDRYYDPSNEFESLEMTIPFDIRLQSVFDPVLENKVLGYVGILSGFPWETDKYYVPYDAIKREIPGVWVSQNNGKSITELMEKGTVRGRISYSGKISEITSHNVTGTLPGMSEEWIVIRTHHDGPWNSAVEDASGMALVLGQAKYWSQVPKEQRPFNLMFLMNCAHMAGGIGTRAFVEGNKDFRKKIVTAIHLEHVARDVRSKNGKLIPLDAPTVRWWFVSRILALEEITEDAIIKEDLQRSMFLPPDGLIPGMEGPPTDGAFYPPAGVPFVSFLTAPPYLFDPADTIDKIHQESFEPLTRAVIRIINALKGQTAEGLRKQILTKKERKRIRRKQLK